MLARDDSADAGFAPLLLWMTFRSEHLPELPSAAQADVVAGRAQAQCRVLRRVGVALEAEDSDAAMLGEAIALRGSTRRSSS